MKRDVNIGQFQTYSLNQYMLPSQMIYSTFPEIENNNDSKNINK
jgi:hypothetical protein